MPITSTVINGCNAGIVMNDHVGVPYDISGSSNEWNMELTLDQGDYRLFGDRGTYRLSCGKDATLSVVGVYSQDSRELMQMMLNWYFYYPGQARYLHCELPQAIIGADRFFGNWVLNKLPVAAKATEAGPISVSIDLMIHGLVGWQKVSTS